MSGNTMFSWTCPYCERDTTIVDTNFQSRSSDLHISNDTGELRLTSQFIVCPNPDCMKVTIRAGLFPLEEDNFGRWHAGDIIKHWNLMPDSGAKQFPDYVPKAITEDYTEACKIRDLSPKASATLSRRCLQGMIRDFWKVKKNRLVDEIIEIKDKVNPSIWDAIDSVRKIGNIGAHMEKDINLIVEVDPNEAQILIDLVEMLIKEWYVQQHERDEKLKEIKALGKKKEEAKRNNSSSSK